MSSGRAEPPSARQLLAAAVSEIASGRAEPPAWRLSSDSDRGDELERAINLWVVATRNSEALEIALAAERTKPKIHDRSHMFDWCEVRGIYAPNEFHDDDDPEDLDEMATDLAEAEAFAEAAAQEFERLWGQVGGWLRWEEAFAVGA
jgi:hypothetical protein